MQPSSNKLEIHPSARIHPSVRIDVAEGAIGAGAVILEGAVIEGRCVSIGREAFIGRGAWIGGGSCRDPQASLIAGDFLHLGANAHVNIARPVRIGHEVGVGVETKIFTHGAYLSAWDGFPVQWAGVTLGDRVWLPNAWVNPGVTVGADVVVAARSLVSSDLPAGCLAAGTPAAPIRLNAYPKLLTSDQKAALFARIHGETQEIAGARRSYEAESEGCFMLACGARFDLDARTIDGPSDAFTELLRQQLRRNGVRFRFEAIDGGYRPWRSV